MISSVHPVFKKLYSYCIVFVSLSVLNACSNLQTAQDYLLNSEEGLAFFTMTQSGIISDNFELVFVNDSTNAEYSINLRKNDENEIGGHDSKGNSVRSFDNPIGKLSVLRLPEGLYHLSGWKSLNSQMLGKNSLSHVINKKFRVMAGHSLYLGNIHLINTAKNSSVFIRDFRIRDVKLFHTHYSRVDASKLLISSKLFLDPEATSDRVFDSFSSCSLEGYQLISKKRLPVHLEKFRKIKIGKEEKQISRIDGYRLKYRIGEDGPVTINMKIEMSAAKDYISDKKNLIEWFENIKKTTKYFKLHSEDKGYFSEYQLKSYILDENRMIFMVIMFDDSSQIITTMTFLNPPEFMRGYKTFEEFLPIGMQTVNSYQQCVIANLNKFL